MTDVNKNNVVNALIKTCKYSELGNPECQHKEQDKCVTCPKMLLMCKIMGTNTSNKIELSTVMGHLSKFKLDLDEVAIFINDLMLSEKIKFKG